MTIVGTTFDKLKLLDNPTGIFIILLHFRIMLNSHNIDYDDYDVLKEGLQEQEFW